MNQYSRQRKRYLCYPDVLFGKRLGWRQVTLVGVMLLIGVVFPLFAQKKTVVEDPREALERIAAEIARVEGAIAQKKNELAAQQTALERLRRDSAAAVQQTALESTGRGTIGTAHAFSTVNKLEQERAALLAERKKLVQDSMAVCNKRSEAEAKFRAQKRVLDSLTLSARKEINGLTAEREKLRSDSAAAEKQYLANVSKYYTERLRLDSMITAIEAKIGKLYADLAKAKSDSAAAVASQAEQQIAIEARLKSIDSIILAREEEKTVLMMEIDKNRQEQQAAQQRRNAVVDSLKKLQLKLSSDIRSLREDTKTIGAQLKKLRIDSAAIASSVPEPLQRAVRELQRIDAQIAEKMKELRPFLAVGEAVAYERQIAEKDMELSVLRSLPEERQRQRQASILQKEEEIEKIKLKLSHALAEAANAKPALAPDTTSLAAMKDKAESIIAEKNLGLSTLQVERQRIVNDSADAAAAKEGALEKIRQQIAEKTAQLGKLEEELVARQKMLDAARDDSSATEKAFLQTLQLCKLNHSKLNEEMAKKEREKMKLKAELRTLAQDTISGRLKVNKLAAQHSIALRELEKQIASAKERLSALSAQRQKIQPDSSEAAAQHQVTMAALKAQVMRRDSIIADKSKSIAPVAQQLEKMRQDSIAYEKEYHALLEKAVKALARQDSLIALKDREIRQQADLVKKLRSDSLDMVARSLAKAASWQNQVAAGREVIVKIEKEIANLEKSLESYRKQIQEKQAGIAALVNKKEQDLAQLMAERERLSQEAAGYPKKKAEIEADAARKMARQDSIIAARSKEIEQEHVKQAEATRQAEISQQKLEEELAPIKRDIARLDSLIFLRRQELNLLVAQRDKARGDSAIAVRKHQSQRTGALTNASLFQSGVGAKQEEIKLAQKEKERIVAEKDMLLRKNDESAARIAILLARHDSLIEVRRKELAELGSQFVKADPAAPAAVASARAVESPAPHRQKAQHLLTRIYDLIGEDRFVEAQKLFKENFDLLNKNLEAEVFVALRTTLDEMAKASTVKGKQQSVAEQEPQAATTLSTAYTAPVSSASAPKPASAAAPCTKKDGTVYIASVPPRASVYLDNELLGQANTTDFNICSGTHTLKVVQGDDTCTKTVTFKPGKNPSMVVKIPCL